MNVFKLFAADPVTPTLPGCADYNSGLCANAGEKGVGELIANGVAIFMWIIGALAVIVIIIAGIMYATAAGDEAKTKTARHMIIYSLVGLAVAILAGTVATFVRGAIGK
jgi:hypothetical protein